MQKAIRMWWVFHHFGFPKEQLKVRPVVVRVLHAMDQYVCSLECVTGAGRRMEAVGGGLERCRDHAAQRISSGDNPVEVLYASIPWFLRKRTCSSRQLTVQFHVCGGSFKSTTNALVGLDAVKQGIKDGVQFVDARSPAEYSGVNPAGNARGGEYLTGVCDNNKASDARLLTVS